MIFLTTSYSKELNSIRHHFAVANDAADAWNTVAELSKKQNTDYEPISTASLYDLLKDLERVMSDEEHKD